MTGSEAAAGLRFLVRLPAVLRHRIGGDEALAIVRERLATRERDFLALLRDAVFAVPRQPLRWLLARAGCAYGDVERLVAREGLEGALRALFRAGVYLTADELSGRVPLVRGRDQRRIRLGDLRSPWSDDHLLARSGGSRSGTPGAFGLDLDALLEHFPDYRVAHDALGAREWADACWTAPGSTALAISLRNVVALDRPLERWFSPVDVADPALPRAYRWAATAARSVARLQGVRLPPPEFVSPAEPLPIARWLAAAARRGATPCISLYPTAAMRLCEAAGQAGIDLRGAWLSLRGEPVTAARVAAVRRAGAEPFSLYGTIETGIVGHGCLRPVAPDEVHLHDDLHAIVQPGADGPGVGLPADALLLTTLRRHARLVLLNASLGDQAELSRRACGCGLEAVGWRTHLSGIHSFEKLTGMGMTFAAVEVAGVLEDHLPARFGGLGTDYQLVEEEAADGSARLRLLVHPRLGPLDEAAVVDAFLAALAAVSPTRRMMTVAWRNGDIVRVDRRAPLVAPSGKVMHFRGAAAR